jgi:drug/metabolite transporter (DMT)-like permease
MIGNVALLLAISLAWAAGYLFIGAARLIPPITATAAMTVIGAIVIAGGVRLGFKRPLLATLKSRPWVPMVMGLSAIALPNLATVTAEHAVPPGLAALLGTTVPIATILLTTFVTHESPYSHIRMLGILLAISGLFIFVGGWSALVGHAAELWGILIMMAGGMVFALNGLLAARQTRDLDPYGLAAWTIIFGAAALAVAAFLFERPLAVDFAPVLWPLLAEGVLGMGLAYLGYYMLISRAGAAFTSLYAFLVPLLGVVGAALVYGESLTASHAAGLATVLAGLALLTHGEHAKPLGLGRRAQR